jgi:NAD(P)-dependent dehydrogenase (short-subunit alcohol dehydrogenase family)
MPMIRECIVTTLNEEGKVHIAPLGLIAEPDDIARWVEKLCDPRETFVTGAVLAIDGGQTLNGWKSAIADAAATAS